MSWLHRCSVLCLLLVLLTFGVSCTSSTLTEPTIEPHVEQPQLANSQGSSVQLIKCSPRPYATATEIIGRKGGVIAVGAHKLTIPENALSRKVAITAEEIPGSTVSVRFSPEGLQFKQPVKLMIKYDGCEPVSPEKKVVYTDENLGILQVLFSSDVSTQRLVVTYIDHFSRYAVAF